MTDQTEKPKWPVVKIGDPKPTAVWLTKRVEAMMSLFYQPTISDDADLMASAIWLEVLGPIPQAAIDRACQEWERDETRRPTPAAIRQRALAHIPTPARSLILAPPAEVITPEELEQRQAFSAKMAKEFPRLLRSERGKAW